MNLLKIKVYLLITKEENETLKQMFQVIKPIQTVCKDKTVHLT